MLFSRFDALQVQHDAGRRLLRFQWLDPANHYLRPALEHGRDLVVTHQPTHVLMDFHGLPPVSLADELWASVHWLPRIAAQPLQSVALVLRSEHLHNQLVIEATLWACRHLVRFELQVFEHVPAALDWLLQGDDAAARHLQAEWEAGVAAPRAAALPS